MEAISLIARGHLDKDVTTVVLSFIGGVLLILFLYIGVKREGGKVLCGPTPWPVIGNVLQINLKKPHLTLAKWAREYGDVYAIRLFKQNIIVLSGEESIREALLLRANDFAGRPKLYRTDLQERSLHDIVWQTFTPRWLALRKIVHRSLRAYGLGLREIEAKSMHEINRLLDIFESKRGAAFDPHMEIYTTVANIMLVLLVGKSLPYGHRDIYNIKRLNELFNEGFSAGQSRLLDLLPWLRYTGIKSFNQLSEGLQIREDLHARYVEPLKGSFDPENVKCVVESLILAHKNTHHLSGHAGHIGEESIREAFTNLILAGTDTTFTAIICFILLMASHPDVQDRLRDEIDQVVGKDRRPTLSDRQNMPYMGATLFELLRYISHIPLAIPHCTTVDTQVMGYSIPKDTQIYINLWGLHHDERYWERPWTFDPSRFLDENGHVLPPDHATRKRLLTFSAGRRVCLGEALAKSRLFLFTSSLLQRFTLQPDGVLPSTDPRDFEMGLVLHPDNFKIKAVPRL
ncbi:steroid 17-alpha-hydroxylase/17,20 lyase [Lingula anatina]|uniref:Steroid 17-alpha-hydroxylase/17,20 lyase n=1 Tax=Lingula anatina TaxID=7574 RepID=A0A1S3H1Z6_LINAN|nr:steroid 17-alpha-hydroxylase/17,20 lyase [Lingula anatina]|eukprot:XP_013380043.1 steroid 17-alpha-hydroxylase/17,20 lyase [Lingula anatina]